ncbi:C1 family peptidase [Paenibacillus taichungensis]|uniref:C1 family peptidase n=1 Tax=Paenibacillus taichungensis TaxID=484184 RepID=A0ABX2MLD1_9BACL|nr:C1 family peptidase [Paenibacillus taichungensis]NUU54830.1 C1 family peptidase [Paenibacillus taichungensis]
MKPYFTGYIPSPLDKRDISMEAFLPTFNIPEQVDYTNDMSPIRPQGNEGTCVAFAAVVGVKEYQEKKEHEHTIELSPRYLYQKCKELDGIPDEEGTYPRVAVKVLYDQGCCEESYWPYIACELGTPQIGADENAAKYRIKAFASLNSISSMKRSLVINGPFIAGVVVFEESWFNEQTDRTGVIGMPPEDLISNGGHAICIVGYDNTTKRFKFKNSWGDGWGERGYGYLPYEYMKRYCTEAWSSTDLIDNPEAIIKAKENILDRFDEDYVVPRTDKLGITYH